MHSEKKQRKICCLIIYFLLLLAGLIVSIILAVKGLKNDRGEEIDEFEAATKVWAKGKRETFENYEIVISDGISTQSNILEKKILEPIAEDLSGDAHGKLPYYSPLHYYLHQDLFLNNQFGIMEEFVPNLESNIQILLNSSSKNYMLEWEDGSVNKSLSVFLKSENTTLKHKYACDHHEGFWDEKEMKCYQYLVLSDICLKISLTDDKWQLNSTWGTYGCFGDDFVPFVYTIIRIMQGETIADRFPYNFQGINIKLREGNDPLLVARKVTNNSLDFGTPAKEFLWLSVVGMIVFTLLLIHPSISLTRLFKTMRDEARTQNRMERHRIRELEDVIDQYVYNMKIS